ncbi:MAG: DNA-binding MarR family transcriptional regulator [Nitrospinales bacterium]|jgi:DNA-binding MarR family transcriptional regulator
MDRLSRVLDSEARLIGVDCNLQPMQLNALHFLKSANRYSNTSLGVIEYRGLTKGTVSQALAVLESKGFIDKTTGKKDGRVIHIDVTRSGRKLLEKAVPSYFMRNVWEELTNQEQNQLVKDLKPLLITMQKMNGMKSYGVCGTSALIKKEAKKSFL